MKKGFTRILKDLQRGGDIINPPEKNDNTTQSSTHSDLLLTLYLLSCTSYQPEKDMAVTEEQAIKDLAEEEVEDLRETFRTFDKVRTQSTQSLESASSFFLVSPLKL